MSEFFGPLLRSDRWNTPNLVLKLIALITLLLFVYFPIKKVQFYSSLSAGLFSSLECFSFSVRIPDFFFMSPFLHKTISFKRQSQMDDVNTVCMPCYIVIKYLFHWPLYLTHPRPLGDSLAILSIQYMYLYWIVTVEL